MLIFVFDPLAITLVIATNQAFAQRKPKQGNVLIGTSEDAGYKLHIDPKPTEEKSTVVVTPQPVEYNNIETEKQAIQFEIDKITRSGVSGRKSGPIIEQLQNRLRDLDNTITY